MINKCKVEMRGGELYNVRESLREGDKRTVLRGEKEQNHRGELHPCVFIFGSNIIHALDRIGSLRLSSLTHSLQIFYCGLRFGPRPDQ